MKAATRDWIAKAEADYLAAVDLARRRKLPLHDMVCFHCQQSAEKYLKARLEEGALHFPKPMTRKAFSVLSGGDPLLCFPEKWAAVHLNPRDKTCLPKTNNRSTLAYNVRPRTTVSQSNALKCCASSWTARKGTASA